MAWVEVSDEIVRHVWQCTDDECECDHEECYYDPSWYENNGTPSCESSDLTYIRTEIDTSHLLG